MADSTIANLTDGATADATDRIPVERSPFGAGTNRYITPAYLETYIFKGKVSVSSTAGQGLSVTAGTAASAVSALSITQTWNYAAAAIQGVDWTFTDTSSHANTNAFRIRGGASGTTLLASLDKSGIFTIGYYGRALVWAATDSGSSPTTYGPLIQNGAAIGGTRAGLYMGTGHMIAWDSSTNAFNGSPDTGIARVSANQVAFSGGTAGGGVATSRAEINKAVTAFTDGVAKTVFTLTIPNAAHSASYLVRLTGSIGAGGAIGANEASATNCYVVTLTRTAGANAVAGISAAFGASTAAVAGATTVTCTAALAAVSGAVGATNTIGIQATITKGGGSSDNHTCVATASLLNANASGITIA